MSTTISRIAAGLLVTAGLAVGSAAMAPVAYAESNTSVGADSSTERKKKSVTTPRSGPVGLNGNRPQTSGKPGQFQYFPKTLDQFKHLPFDPAMPGGD